MFELLIGLCLAAAPDRCFAVARDPAGATSSRQECEARGRALIGLLDTVLVFAEPVGFKLLCRPAEPHEPEPEV